MENEKGTTAEAAARRPFAWAELNSHAPSAAVGSQQLAVANVQTLN